MEEEVARERERERGGEGEQEKQEGGWRGGGMVGEDVKGWKGEGKV